MNKKTITTIVKKADECVVYHDDGIYCSWTETKPFNFELISEVKAEADGIVLLVSEEEAKEMNGAKFDDHEAWILPKWLIWMVYGEMETDDEEEEKLVSFLKSLQI